MKTYEEELYEEYFAFRLHKRLLLCLSPVIFTVGIIGNVLSVAILTRRPFRREATYAYLTAVSAADSFLLVFGLLRQWLSELTGHDPTVFADWTCKTIMVFNYTFSVYSVWLIVAVAVERYLAVSRPLSVAARCTRQRTVPVIILLFVAALAFNIHFAWTLEVNLQIITSSNSTDLVAQCNAPADLNFAVNIVWPWIDLSIYLLAPFVTIAVLNSIIIHEVVKARRQRGSMSEDSRRSRRPAVDSVGNARLAVMLAAVSFAFLLLTLPMCVWQSAKMLLDLDLSDMASMSAAALATTVSRLLMYTNHAANFYLYCATGMKFRRQLRASVCSSSSSSRCLAIAGWTSGSNGVPRNN